jgi:SAM-dependent methyltransferase
MPHLGSRLAFPALAVSARIAAIVGRGELAKRVGELGYWHRRAATEGSLGNAHYRELFTDAVGLDPEFYRGKRILDVGCGPRGSLEWAAEFAAECVGADPLAPSYRRFGTDAHRMVYVAAGAESLPFPDRSFDVVSSINSLDHVDDVDAAIAEISLVAARTIILIVEVNHKPTLQEPHTLSWDITSAFQGFVSVVLKRLEHQDGGIGDSIRAGVPYDDVDSSFHHGVLVAWLERAA